MEKASNIKCTFVLLRCNSASDIEIFEGNLNSYSEMFWGKSGNVNEKKPEELPSLHFGSDTKQNQVKSKPLMSKDFNIVLPNESLHLICIWWKWTMKHLNSKSYFVMKSGVLEESGCWLAFKKYSSAYVLDMRAESRDHEATISCSCSLWDVIIKPSFRVGGTGLRHWQQKGTSA